jgi:ribosome-binding protein aMBF1 (putative translation factor)
MMNCSICGISDSKIRVFRAVSPKEIVIVCEKCAAEEGFPMLKKLEADFEDLGRGKSVYERMTELSGIKPREPEQFELRRQEKDIRGIVNKNYEEKIKKQALNLKSRPDLVDNFHWIIMRVRRVKGLTQKDLADRIGELEAVIKMAEQGIVPEGYQLIDKLERFLKVKLIKSRDLTIPTHPVSQSPQPPQPAAARALNFDKKILDSLTIADLQRMKKEKEAARIAEESEEKV